MVEEESKTRSIATRISTIRRATGLNQTEFGEKIGVTQGNLSNYEKGKTEPGSRIIQTLLDTFHVQESWWENGLGNMFYTSGSGPLVMNERGLLQTKQLVEKAPDSYVPYYNIDVTMEHLEACFSSSDLVPEGYVYAPHYRGCVMVNIYGDSMSDRITSGSRLYVYPVSGRKYIDYGQIYLVVLDGHRLLKYIQKHPTDESKVILASHNTHYQDWEVDKSDILNLYLVKGFENQQSL